MNPPKKILITVFRGLSASNILRSGVLAGLLENGLQVVLLTTSERAEYYQKEFRHEQVSVIGITESKEKIGDAVVRFLAQNSVRNERVLFKHVEDLYTHKTLGALLRFFFKRAIGFLGLIPGVRAGIRILALRFVPSHAEIRALLQRENPQLVFSSDVVQDTDVIVLRETRRLGIGTIGLVSGWDNLTNPGFLRIVPDILLVHSPWLKRAAIDRQGILEEKIKMVGIPQYDSFFRKDFLMPRAAFLESLGMDTKSRLILFAAMGSLRLAPYEWETPQMINDAIERGDLPSECVVVARPHPKYGIHGIHAKKPVGRHLFIDEPAKYLGASVETLEMEKSHLDHLANLLYHADVVVTGASTITIDAAVLDRPVINVAFDGGHTLPDYQSIRKNYYYFTHYIVLVKTKGMRLVFSEQELIGWIKKYLANPSIDREERKQIVQDFVGFTDGRSVERIVSALVDMLAA